MDADIAVIWSVLWNGRMTANKSVFHHYRSQNKPVIVMDVGALRRNVTWKLAVNHINNLGYYGHNINLDYDRPKKLGIELQNLKRVRPEILIAAQHHRSLQLEGIDQELWINQTVEQIKKVSDRPIVIRSHPRSKLNSGLLHDQSIIFQAPVKLNNSYDDFDIDYSYHCVVNYNSGPGSQAAIAGATVMVDRSSLAFPISTTIENIDKRLVVDRTQWFVELSHTEYTVEELSSGMWFHRIQQEL